MIKKKLFTLVAAMVMLSALALPAFASTSASEDAFFRSYNGQGEYLNAWGGAVYEGMPIRLYTYTGDNSQKWRVYQASDGTYSLRSCANTSLAINRDSNTSNAILWTWANGRTDSDMRVYKYDNDTRYHFVLIDGNQYLTALDKTTGSYVKFQTYNSTASQWKKM